MENNKESIAIKRYTVYWTDLNPSKGAEMHKRRPCIVISPDELNRYLQTVVIVPLTTALHEYPWRFEFLVNGEKNFAAIDQIRTIDKSRIIRFFAELSSEEKEGIHQKIQNFFG
jgi:mRNA interferase MazF